MSFILGKFYLPVLRFAENGRSVFKVYSSLSHTINLARGWVVVQPWFQGGGHNPQLLHRRALNRSSRSCGRRRPVSFIFLQADNSNIYSLFCARQVYYVEKSPGTCLSNTIDSWLGEEHCRPKESSNIELDNIDRTE